MPSSPDKPFPQPHSVSAIADWINGRVEGDAHLLISGVSSLAQASSSELSFFSNRRYHPDFLSTKAGAIIVSENEVVPSDFTVIRCEDPYVGFATVVQRLYPKAVKSASIHPMAVVDDTATIGEGVHIEPFVYVAEGVHIGNQTWIESGARIGAHAQLGVGCHIKANAVVGEACILGSEVILQPGAVVGADGFGFAGDSEKLHKIPQVGRVRIGDGVELGAHTCVDRPVFGETIVHSGVKTDNFVQVGHSAEIGAHSLMVAYSGVAGSTYIGPRSILAAKAAVLGHLTLGASVHVGAGAVVHRNVDSGTQVSGYPAIEHRDWLRQSALLKRLPEMKSAIDRLSGKGHSQLNLLPHRYPFIFLDKVVTLNSPTDGHAVKCLSRSEPYFQGHFPDRPIFPGVLQIEAMAQLSGSVALGRKLKDGEIVMLAAVDRVRFHRAAVPGDQLIITCELVRQLKDMYIYDAQINCTGKRVSAARITVAHQIIEKTTLE